MSSDKRNVLIEIARWTAPLATVGGLFLIFRNALAKLRDVIKIFSGGATAVYGNNHCAETLRRNVKKSVRGDTGRVNGAGDHILLFDTESENLEFYDKNKKDLKDKRVFIQMDGVLPLLDALVTLYPDREIHVNDASGRLLERIFRHERLRSFGALEDILTEENIKTDTLYRSAKLLNYRYFLLYGGKAPQGDLERAMEEMWETLDGFTKYANIAAADYHALRLKIIERAKQDGVTLLQEEMDELEHIRWCRYHYLNNWQYGVPENGKAKDARLRIHRCLVPFTELPGHEREKDTEMIGTLMEISRDTDIFRM